MTSIPLPDEPPRRKRRSNRRRKDYERLENSTSYKKQMTEKEASEYEFKDDYSLEALSQQ